MDAYRPAMKRGAPATEGREAQLRYLCHFLDVFASGDPVMRAGAVHCGGRLRDDGYSGDEIIKMTATALLVAIEHEIGEGGRVYETH